MQYFVQSNWSFPTKENEWKTINSSRAGNQVFDNLETAIKYFEINTNMARMICPQRVIDSEGKVIRYYDPDFDDRLPGNHIFTVMKVYLDKKTKKNHQAIHWYHNKHIEDLFANIELISKIDEDQYLIDYKYMFSTVKRGEWIVRGFAQSIPDHIFKENFVERKPFFWLKEMP